MSEHIQSPIFESNLDDWDLANEDFTGWDDDLNFSPTPVTPHRWNSDPVIPSSGPIRSSPIVGTIQERRVHRLRKAKRSREQKQTAKRRDAEGRREEVLENVLSKVLLLLESEQLKLWDLLEFVFNPEYKQGKVRYGQFFAKKGRSTFGLVAVPSKYGPGGKGRDPQLDCKLCHSDSLLRSQGSD